MNPQKFNELADRYMDNFAMINSGDHIEYYKWIIAKQFRPAMDQALAASDGDFHQQLYEVKKLTKNLIDSYTQPFHGLVQFAKNDPAAVRGMLQDLLSVSEADLKTKEEAIFRFLDRSHELRAKYFPDSYLYNDDLHSATGYLFLYAPDNNYLYKPSHSRIFADCIEFYDDWGSGADTKLDVFWRMCGQCLDAINNNPALLKTAESRFDIAPDSMHPDSRKHILLFDMIYCCSTYSLFDGISINSPRGPERQLIQARREKARELKQDLDAAEAKAAELDAAIEVLNDAVTPGKAVRHKTFGSGVVQAVGDGSFTAMFDAAGEKHLGIVLSVANGLVSVDGLELSAEQLSLLRDQGKIRSMLSFAEKSFAEYAEYLD